MRIDSDLAIVLFDIVSSFTNVSVEESIPLAAEMFYSCDLVESPIDIEVCFAIGKVEFEQHFDK